MTGIIWRLAAMLALMMALPAVAQLTVDDAGNVTATPPVRGSSIHAQVGQARLHTYLPNAGASTTADGYNLFIGEQAGNFTMQPAHASSNFEASYNVGIGSKALTALTFGYSNTAIGAFALQGNTEGHYNTAIGKDALAYSTTGHDNTAIGKLAIGSTTCPGVACVPFTGSANVGIGKNALANLTTGSSNTVIGRNAGYSTTSGVSNVMMGEGAGYTVAPANANVSGYQNVWIGDYAGPGTTSQLHNSTAIGYRALSTKSDQFVLGNSNVTETVTWGAIVNNGTAGVSCTGLPTAAFQVVNGIVVQC
jgi:hypothetical protein